MNYGPTIDPFTNPTTDPKPDPVAISNTGHQQMRAAGNALRKTGHYVHRCHHHLYHHYLIHFQS